MQTPFAPEIGFAVAMETPFAPEIGFAVAMESAPLLGGSGAAEMVYTIVLPLLEGSFRACLQGNAKDELELCLESGM